MLVKRKFITEATKKKYKTIVRSLSVYEKIKKQIVLTTDIKYMSDADRERKKEYARNYYYKRKIMLHS